MKRWGWAARYGAIPEDRTEKRSPWGSFTAKAKIPVEPSCDLSEYLNAEGAAIRRRGR